MILNAANAARPSAEPAPPLLEVRGMEKWFGRFHALRAVDFSVRAGEILGLIGPNGSGKTTLLECVAGLQADNGGQVRYCGGRLAPRKRRAAMFYVPENVVPYCEHRVHQTLAFFSVAFGQTASRRCEIIDALNLTPLLDKRASQLSKGGRRKLLLALGLMAPHPLLLMDEPFDGLDLRQTREAMTALRELTNRGRTLVLSIHQLTDAQRVCDRFVLLSHGRAAGEGTLAELQSRAALSGASLEDVFLALS